MNDQAIQSGDKQSPLRVAIVVVLVIAAALFAWVGFRWSQPGETSGSDKTTPINLADVVKPGAARGFNLLLVTLDTTRVDRLGCYGYANAATPTIDGLVDQGVRFDNAVSSVPITLPSHSVMMTGKYPPTTGVRYNGTDRLTDEHTTLAEKLKDAGYETAAFVSAFVLEKRFGLAQGFDTYDFDIGNRVKRHFITLHNERSADDVTASALSWLKERSKNDPFFMWVHYFDPHAPYVSPLATLGQFRDRPYDAEIAFMDAQLRRIIEHLDKSGMRDNTLIVIASDHGESLGEHGEAYHLVFVYEATMHAAIILSCPALFDGAYRVDDRLVGLVDLYPTLTELFGLETEDGLDGFSMLTREAPNDRAIYIETTYPAEIGCSPLYGLRGKQDKFILAPRPEYYDLRSDPKELENLYTGQSAKAKELEMRLEEMLDRWSGGAAQNTIVQLSEEDKLRLESLGYLQAAGGNTATINWDCDPKDHIDVINGMTLLQKHIVNEEIDEAIQLGQELAAAAEGFSEPVRKLASLYIEKRGDWDKAISLLDEFVKKHPYPDMLYMLASALDHEGRDEECENTLVAAEKFAPDLGAFQMLRGDRARREGRLKEALEFYEKALAIDPVRIAPDVQPKLHDLRKELENAKP